MSYVFYISHCPFDELSQKILNLSIASIEKHYPDSEIFVIYSESNRPFEIQSQNTRIHKCLSPLQNSSVIGAFQYYLESGDTRKAFFLHDSMILKGRLDEKARNDFGFLWYFQGKEYLGLQSIQCEDLKRLLFEAMNNTSTDIFYGCFGLALYSRREPLKKLWAAIDWKLFVNHPQRAKALQDLERILGFYASALELLPESKDSISVCGNIFHHPFAFHKWYNGQSLDYIEALPYDEPVIKAWLNRFLRA